MISILDNQKYQNIQNKRLAIKCGKSLFVAVYFHGNEVRTLLIYDEPYFVGKDVAEVLGYSNTKDALSKHIDVEDKTIIQKSQIATLENIPNRGLTIINESGLYSLILSSKLPQAKEFKR